MFATEKDHDYLILKMFLISVLRLKLDPYKCHISVRCSELPKENIKEYRKTLDINVILNNNLHLDIELNNSKYSKIVTRNGLYESKLFTMAFESGSKIDDFLNQYVCQLNLNNYEKINSDNEIEKLEGEDIIASTSIKTGNIILLNRLTILRYLDYYRNLYYNYPNECKKDELWLALLTSENFSQLGEILEKLLPDKMRDNFIEEAINMSNDNFVLHDWQREKMAELEKAEEKRYYENMLKKGITDGLEQGIEQGIEKGIEQEKINNIKSMLENNIEIDLISKVSGKSIEEIKEIEKSLKD